MGQGRGGDEPSPACCRPRLPGRRCMTAEQIAQWRSQSYNATVVRLIKHHSDLIIMRVRPDYPLPVHKAGQYSTLGLGYWEPRHDGCQPETILEKDLPKVVKRAYSISCSVLDDGGAL